MKTLDEALQIVRGSKQFTFNGSTLEVTGYYTGETLRLDLSKLDEDILNALQVDDDYNEDDEW